MAQQLLTLLDDALSELHEAHLRFAAQKRLSQDQQTLLPVVQAIRSAYLAVEKLFKHALASIDPYLVYEELRPVSVRSLIKDLRASGSPSPLASRNSLRTLTLLDSWGAIQELDLLPIDSTALSQFGATLKQLISVRRLAQHAELWVTPQELLSLLEQLFAQIRTVGNTLIPDLDKRLSAVDPKLVYAFRAIEEKVDKGWIHLRELLAEGKFPVFEVGVITYLAAPDHDPELVFLADGRAANYIFGRALVPKAQASGLFTMVLEKDQIQPREELMAEDLPVADISDSDIPSSPPSPPGFPSALWIPVDEATKRLQEAIRMNIVRRQLAVERFGLKPLEDGTLTLSRMAVWGHWVHPGDPKLTMLSQILLQDLEIRYTKGHRIGQFHSRLLPSPDLEGALNAKPLQLTGSLWMTGEFVTDERTASEHAPAGTVVRFHRARLKPEEAT